MLNPLVRNLVQGLKLCEPQVGLPTFFEGGLRLRQEVSAVTYESHIKVPVALGGDG
jgi:hypothetical protein